MSRPGLVGCGHHFRAAAGVNGEHRNREGRKRLDGFRDRIRNVVQFEVEEDVVSESRDFLDECGTVAGEQLKTDFDGF